MSAIRKVLFPTKFETLSFSCVERLFPLRQAGLEEIVFLFVIDREEVAFNLFSGFDRKLADEMKEEARLRFEDWGRRLEEVGIRSRHVIEVGNPEGKILEVACREPVDLIVSGRQHHQPADKVYLGGTAMGLLRRSAIPVFLCKHRSETLPACEPGTCNDFERVLYATDFSEDASRALDLLKTLHGAVKRADLVHVIVERDFQKHTPEEIRAEEAACLERLEALCGELRALGVEAAAHVLGGNTTAEILQAAADSESTVILMGTKGRHGLREMWLGSASHRVAELAPMPVLLVPREREECYI